MQIYSILIVTTALLTTLSFAFRLNLSAMEHFTQSGGDSEPLAALLQSGCSVLTFHSYPYEWQGLDFLSRGTSQHSATVTTVRSYLIWFWFLLSLLRHE